MSHRMVVFAAVLVLCGTAWADYVAERKAAAELSAAGKHEEALVAFVKMSEGEVSDFQKSDALKQAVLLAIRLKDYDRADALAAQIPLAPASKTASMQVLLARRQWKELVEKFKDEDFAAWPDEVAAEAFELRGRTYGVLRDGAKAEADFKAALARLTIVYARAQMWLSLADNYRNNLQDAEQALNAYRQVIAAKTGRGGWLALTAVVGAANILREQGKYAEAHEVLAEADMQTLTGYWRGAVLAARGETLAAEGKKAEALACFTEAVGLENVPDYRIKDWQKRLDELKGLGELPAAPE